MPRKKILQTDDDVGRHNRRITPEQRESQLIALAYDLVEERLRNGTATSQETTEFLKRGSVKARLEKEILEKQKELLEAKTEALQSQKRMEELYADAIKAARSYAPPITGETRIDDIVE